MDLNESMVEEVHVRQNHGFLLDYNLRY